MILDFRDFTQDNIVYLWVLHGTNISAHNNYYPFDIKFRNLMFYSKPYEPIDDKTLLEFNENPCKILTGSCPIFPVKDKNNRKIVYLPPLFFSPANGNNDDSDEMRNLMGLYKFNIKDCQTGFDDNGNNEMYKIYNFEMLIDQYPFGTMITYSQLFKHVLDDCKENNYDVNKVIVGIYSCQSSYEKYTNKYFEKNLATLKKPYVQNIYDIEKADIYNDNDINNIYNNDINNVQFNDIIELTSVRHYLNGVRQGEALGGITHQGCAINVFTYFDIIQDENRAREIIACLPSKGTSIFKIVDNINYYIILQKNKNKNNVIYSNYENENRLIKGYLILRFDIQIAVKFMLKYATDSILNNNNFVIIFKLYNQPENYEKIHSGHTISISKINKNFYLIDPQIGLNYEINNIINEYKIGFEVQAIEELSNYLINKYNKNQIDLIFTIFEENIEIENHYSETILDFIKNNDIVKDNIVSRKNEIYFGGSNDNFMAKIQKKLKTSLKKRTKTKKTKNKYSTNKKILKIKSRKLKKYINTKSLSKLTNKIYENNDTFEKLMREIDRKNKIKSSLVISNVNKPM